jgi:hypothetical protein
MAAPLERLPADDRGHEVGLRRHPRAGTRVK